MKKIKIIIGELTVDAVLNDTKCAESIFKKLPIEAKTSTWGEEIYFKIPVKSPPENPKAVVNLGDLGYWMPGSAFCIFFGETPASCKGEIRPASPVNIIGKIDLKSIADLKKIGNNEKIMIEKAE